MTIVTTKENKIIKNESLLVNFEDGIHVRTNNAIVELCAIKNTKANKGHLDGIQIIPFNQFGLGSVSMIKIRNNTIYSSANLQGIFCSDGLVRKATIENNVVQTKSPHAISIGGLLSGSIKNNTDASGNPIKARLYPARIGGGNNLWILSWADTINYEPIPSSEFVDDIRTIYGTLKGMIVEGFPYAKFMFEYNRYINDTAVKTTSSTRAAKYAYELALSICKYQRRVT